MSFYMLFFRMLFLIIFEMNTKKLLGCLLIVMMWITACEGPMGPAGRDGRDGIGTNWFVEDFEVLSEHWIPVYDPVMDGDIFEYSFNFPKLSKIIFEEGAVICYLVQNINKNVIQTPLPYTFFGEYQGILYSENYTYEISPGYINFIVKISDFDTQTQPPLRCIFRVVLMW